MRHCEAGRVSIQVLSAPRPLKKPDFIDLTLRNPWAWLLAWVTGWLRIGSVTFMDPLLFMGVVFLAVTGPGMLWSWPTWANRKLTARGLAIGNGVLGWPYPWYSHPGTPPGRQRIRTYRHRLPSGWIDPGVPVGGVHVTAMWAGQPGGLSPLPASALENPNEVLEPALHQVEVTDGERTLRVCKCTSPGMRLAPLVRAVANPHSPVPPKVASVAREV